MAKYNKILVTGSDGLVGSALKSLRHNDAEIVFTNRRDCNLLHWKEVDDNIRKHRPDAIIHLAAKVGGVKANMKSPATFMMENSTMNTHVLEAARIYNVKRMICCLSTCVFPENCPLPLEPKHLHAGPPHPSNYGYAFAKRMLAIQCQSYNEEYGTNFLPVIPSNIYGPNDNFNLENSHVVPALIRKFYESTSKITLWGSGKPLREFIYSLDVAKLIMMLLESYDSNEPIVLSTGTEHSIRELADEVETAMCDLSHYEVTYDTSKPEGQYRKPSCNKPLMALFPDYNFISLSDGLAATVQWFRLNYPDNIRK